VTVASRRSGRALKRLGHQALAGYHQLGSCRHQDICAAQSGWLADRKRPWLTACSVAEWHANGTVIMHWLDLDPFGV